MTTASTVETEQFRLRRESRIRRTVQAGLLARAVSYGVRLAVVPLSLTLLGPEQYGLWLTMGSIIGWLGMSDLGLSPGLVNAVAAVSAKAGIPETRRLVSTGFAAFAVIGALSLALATAGFQWPGLRVLLGIEDRPWLWRDASLLFLICGAFLGLAAPLRAASSVAAALQEGYLTAWSSIFSNVASLAAAGALLAVGAGLPIFAIGMSAPSLLGAGMLSCYLFRRRYPELSPFPIRWHAPSLRTVVGYGGPLMLVQAADVTVLYLANILIANRLGPSEVPHYAVPFALFMIVKNVCYTLASANLPAYVEACERHDRQWIRQRAIRALATVVSLMAASGLVLALVGGWGISMWTSGQIRPDTTLLVSLGFFVLAMAWSDANGILLAGLGMVRCAAVLRIASAAMFGAGAWALLPDLGVAAPAVAGVFAFLPECLIALPMALRRTSQGSPARLGAGRPSYGFTIEPAEGRLVK